MKYDYEALADDTFQKLAQALILVDHPSAQCLPVGQPDGGRDAFVLHVDPEQSQFVVFQVKYSRNPKAKTERIVVRDLIASEAQKVKKLIARGATEYYLITNVQGTAHLDVGSIDATQADLRQALGIPAHVWWRDDLDGRLDNASDIKWSYPQLFRGTDLLLALLERIGTQTAAQSARAVKGYLATQYRRDREIKFKQIDLTRTLTNLFVDLPLGATRRYDSHRDRTPGVRRSNVSGELDAYLRQLDEKHERTESNPHGHSGLAAAYFLHMPLMKGVMRFVLEGAPGQGKSTVTQFICQVNRLRLLNKDTELESVHVTYRTTPIRAPFRIDLRDYAAWFTGRHPFAKEGEEPVPEEGKRSLESFMAMQVSWHSGNLVITQQQLLAFLDQSPSVIVLDGFDEVANIATRTRMVEEVCDAFVRLEVAGCSLQVIVTSRPAAFANSPGFPENDWVHLELGDLRYSNIQDYKKKWIDAKSLSDQESEAVSSTLEAKLRHPHMRDLARNPMQLAILLHLVHVQGVALPEKRTRLYDAYMNLFFNREAEKSEIIRDRRELIMSIHGALAWILQTQAEDGSGTGSVTKAELCREIRGFLEDRGHDRQLADALLTGTVSVLALWCRELRERLNSRCSRCGSILPRAICTRQPFSPVLVTSEREQDRSGSTHWRRGRTGQMSLDFFAAATTSGSLDHLSMALLSSGRRRVMAS